MEHFLPTTFMKTILTSLFVFLPMMSGDIASATVIKPVYVPALSFPNSAGASTPERMVDNSGMIPAIWTGTSLAETLAAKHVFNPLTDASWQTNDPPPAGGHYFGEAPSDPVLVFDLGRNRTISSLIFWQFQRNMPAANWAKDIHIEFAANPPGGVPPDFLSIPPAPDVPLAAPPLPPPVPWTNDAQEWPAAEPLAPLPMARFIKLTITGNRGGPRVGLGEFRVKVDDDPFVELPAFTDVSGDQTPRTYFISIKNLGQSDFSIQSVSFSGPDAGQFAIDAGAILPPFVFDYTVPALSTRMIPMRITPTKAGPIDTLITVVITGSSGPSMSISTKSIGVIRPDPWLIVLAPPPMTELAVGPFPKGVGPQPFQLQIQNYGLSKNLDVIPPLTVSGSAAGNFSMQSVSTLPTGIGPFGEASISGIFIPGGDPGPDFKATITITSTDKFSLPASVGVSASILDDLEITTPPTVTISPLASGTSSFSITLINSNLERLYELEGTPTISGGEGFSVFHAPTVIAASDSIVIEFAQTGASGIGVYPLKISLSLQANGEHLSDFEIKVLVKVRNPVQLVAHGFQDGKFRVSVSNILLEESYHLRASTNLVDWEPLDPPVNVTANGELPLTLGPERPPTMFFRLYEGTSP